MQNIFQNISSKYLKQIFANSLSRYKIYSKIFQANIRNKNLQIHCLDTKRILMCTKQDKGLLSNMRLSSTRIIIKKIKIKKINDYQQKKNYHQKNKELSSKR